MNIDWLIKSQNLLIGKESPALLLAGLAFSLVNSWHCSLMCGPFLANQSRAQNHRLFFWRLVSYTSIGILLGAFGKILIDSPEFIVVRFILFALFAVFSLLFVFPKLLPSALAFKSPLRGLLMGVLPCGSLAVLYSLAVATASPWKGGALLLGHAVMTMPALAYGFAGVKKLSSVGRWVRPTVKVILAVLLLVNLFYFAGRLLYPDQVIANRLLFCF